jgi:hypothetical protein
MFVLSGSLQRFGVTSWLVVALVGPVCAVGWAAWATLRHAWGRALPGEDALAPPDAESLRRAAIGGQLFAAAILAWQGAALFARPADERFLLQHVARVVRAGFFDVSLDLALDGPSLLMGVAACLAGAGLFAGLDARRPARLALAGLVCTGTLVAVLSAGWPTMVGGLSLAGFAAAALAGSSAAIGTFALAEAATVAGAGLLFWCLGGTLGQDGYLPDLDPRVVAAQRAPSDAPLGDDDDDAPSVRVDKEGKSQPLRPVKKAPSALDAKASVSLAGPPGAIVYLDESRTPMAWPASSSIPAYAPFAGLPVPPGLHTFRVHVGAGLDDHVVQHVTAEPGDEIVLATVGSVSTFREATDMIALRTPQGPRFHEALAARRVGEWPALLVVFVLLAAGTALRAAHAVSLGAARMPWVFHAAVGAAILLRLAPLAGLVASARAVLVVSGAVVAVAAAAWVALAPRRDALAGGVVAALVGAVMVGAGAQAVGAGIAVIVAAVLGASALALSADGAGNLGTDPAPQALRAAIGLCAGAVFGLGAILSALSDAPAGTFGLVVAAAAVASLVFGLLRAAFARRPAPKTKQGKGAEAGPRARTAPLLAALAGLGGAGAGFSPGFFGGDEASPIEAVLRPLAQAAPKPTLTGLLVVVSAGIGGWALARSRYQSGAASALERDAAWGPQRFLVAGLGFGPLGCLAGRAVLGIARVARRADDRVVGAVWGAMAGAATLAGSLFGGAAGASRSEQASGDDRGRPAALVVLAVFVTVGVALYLWSNA